jgi:excisionase family DNA binding protein
MAEAHCKTRAVEEDEITSDTDEGGELGWMSTKAASAYLGITARTLYRFIDEGALPAYKMGRVIRLMRRDVDAFIESSRVAPGTLANLYPPRKDPE